MPPVQLARIDFPLDGVSAKLVVALGFSPCGHLLSAVMGDNRHTVQVYQWRKGTLIAQGVGHNGQPPMVRLGLTQGGAG